jgi:beta-phosphoglucomutase-like phosphatase (HAD superfamily)
MVVENAPLGVRAAKAAGLFTCAVNTGPLPDAELAAEGADKIFPDMQALLSWLESLQ